MRFSTTLIVLVGAAGSVSARPVPHSQVADVFPRELQYSDIVALEGAPEYRKHDSKTKSSSSSKSHGSKTHDDFYSHGYHIWDRDHEHSHDHPHELRHPRGEHDHGHHAEGRFPHPRPQDHHHGSPRGDIVDNIVKFLAHETRSVPDVSSRVVQGIVDFLSHEARAEHDEPKNESSLPKTRVIDNIIDFFSSTVKR